MEESSFAVQGKAAASTDGRAAASAREVATFVHRRAQHPSVPGIKVNLYRDYEYRALAQAMAETGIQSVETVMVGDSYFMTHLGRGSTSLDEADSRLAFDLMPRLVEEVRREMDRDDLGARKPLLMADIPSGLTEAQVVAIIQRFAAAGADIVKAEVTGERELWVLDAIGRGGVLGALHIGYAPQSGANRTYGVNAEEVESFVALVDAGARAGAACLVLERLTEVANTVLTRYALSRRMLPYSIFSGRAAGGGQSLNVWDSVVRSGRESIFFPPTAHVAREHVPEQYTVPTIVPCMRRLLQLTHAGLFPPSPHNRLDVDTCLDILAREVGRGAD